MFGGLNLGPTLNNLSTYSQFNVLFDTWIWNGDDWSQATTSVTPPARYGASMAYDPATGNAVLFGGEDAQGHFLSDTWLFNTHFSCKGCPASVTWTEVTTPSGGATPFGRSDASMTYDFAQHGMLASLKLTQAIAKYWSVSLAGDAIGLVDNSGRVQNGFFSYYRANDRVAVGVNYVF